MERLISILRAAHCRSTHHFFAVDALPLVSTERGGSLAHLLLNHHQRYLIGAKDPDTRFKDFRNHVLHVEDGYWGGAAKTAARWYQTLIDRLDDADWSGAAYAAGVLSHYFTDPLMPLHTAQSKRESVVHRPMEWSVTKSYDRILRRWQQGDHQVIFDLAQGEGWLEEAVTRGAEVAHRHYDDLITQYDLKSGAKRPTEGFDETSIDTLAGLFGVALTGWARILERAANQTRSQIPNEPLTIATLVATIKMPVAWVLRRIESHAEQKAVRAIFEEFQQTGRVKHNLPAEVVSVKAEREQDRQAQRLANRPRNAESLSPTAAAPSTLSSNRSEAVIPMGDRAPQPKLDGRMPGLSATDDLVDAPSIGPKTAKRFANIGIHTVAEFLAATPEDMEAKLATRWIKEETLRDWQDQARLVCEVASLCGYKSQLLVGVECRSSAALASENAASLHAKIVQFCKTSAGKRALRSSQIPSCEDIALWIRDARAGGLRQSA